MAIPLKECTVRWVVLGAFGLSGAAALSFEVIWTRSLTVVLGSTTHAVSTMLATFMFGLAAGSIAGGRRADASENTVGDLGLCELGIGTTGLLGTALLGWLPQMYLSAYRAFHHFAALFLVFQVGICGLVMLAPTFLMGMTFPLATRSLTDEIGTMGKRVGAAYSANTAGAVLGSLASGFLLVPVLGLTRSALVAACLNLAAGAALFAASRRFPPIAIPLAAGMILAGVWAATHAPRASLVSVYSAYRYPDGLSFSQIAAQEALDLTTVSERDYAEGPVRALKDREGNLLLQVAGKIEGTGAEDRENTVLLAQLPVAAHTSPKSALVVGLGAGVTLQAAKELVPAVDVVEINPGVIEAVRSFGRPGVLSGVGIVRGDGRNFLHLTDKTYDIISSEPSYPTHGSVNNLFTREFFRIAASKLNRGGIYCQWLPYYILTNDDVTMVIKTFASAFPHVRLWKVPRSMDLILLGSRDPFGVGAAETLRRIGGMRGGGSAPEMVLSRDEAAVRAISADPSVPFNTDDHPILEFRVARNLRVGDLSLLDRGSAQ